jgi:hypothetical protein
MLNKLEDKYSTKENKKKVKFLPFQSGYFVKPHSLLRASALSTFSQVKTGKVEEFSRPNGLLIPIFKYFSGEKSERVEVYLYRSLTLSDFCRKNRVYEY